MERERVSAGRMREGSDGGKGERREGGRWVKEMRSNRTSKSKRKKG